MPSKRRQSCKTPRSQTSGNSRASPRSNTPVVAQYGSVTPGGRRPVLIAALVGAFIVLITIVIAAALLLTQNQKYEIQLVGAGAGGGGAGGGGTTNITPRTANVVGTGGGREGSTAAVVGTARGRTTESKPAPTPQPTQPPAPTSTKEYPDPCFCDGPFCMEEPKYDRNPFVKNVLPTEEVWGENELLLFHLTLPCALFSQGGSLYTLSASFQDQLAENTPTHTVAVNFAYFDKNAAQQDAFGVELKPSYTAATNGVKKFKICTVRDQKAYYVKGISVLISVQRKHDTGAGGFQYETKMYQVEQSSKYLLDELSSTNFKRSTQGKTRVADVKLGKRTTQQDMIKENWANMNMNCECISWGVDTDVTPYWTQLPDMCCASCRYKGKPTSYTSDPQCYHPNNNPAPGKVVKPTKCSK